jgi:hypothetical protein
MDLSEFLLARIAEDEEWARDLWERPHFGSCNTQGDQSSLGDECDCGLPARVLAECEAKRRIVAHYLGSRGALAKLTDPLRRLLGEAINESHADALKPLALPYTDHPDYDESWRP